MCVIVVIGGRASGKRTYVRSLGFADSDMADGVLDERPALLNLQALVAGDERDPQAIAEDLAAKQVVSCCEIGNGIVPLDPGERAWRERTGRTLNILSAQAESVIRMVCGIPVQLK